MRISPSKRKICCGECSRKIQRRESLPPMHFAMTISQLTDYWRKCHRRVISMRSRMRIKRIRKIYRTSERNRLRCSPNHLEFLTSRRTPQDRRMRIWTRSSREILCSQGRPSRTDSESTLDRCTTRLDHSTSKHTNRTKCLRRKIKINRSSITRSRNLLSGSSRQVNKIQKTKKLWSHLVLFVTKGERDRNHKESIAEEHEEDDENRAAQQL